MKQIFWFLHRLASHSFFKNCNQMSNISQKSYSYNDFQNFVHLLWRYQNCRSINQLGFIYLLIQTILGMIKIHFIRHYLAPKNFSIYYLYLQNQKQLFFQLSLFFHFLKHLVNWIPLLVLNDFHSFSIYFPESLFLLIFRLILNFFWIQDLALVLNFQLKYSVEILEQAKYS